MFSLIKKVYLIVNRYLAKLKKKIAKREKTVIDEIKELDNFSMQ